MVKFGEIWGNFRGKRVDLEKKKELIWRKNELIWGNLRKKRPKLEKKFEKAMAVWRHFLSIFGGC
jgi:hypothetical protein